MQPWPEPLLVKQLKIKVPFLPLSPGSELGVQDVLVSEETLRGLMRWVLSQDPLLQRAGAGAVARIVCSGVLREGVERKREGAVGRDGEKGRYSCDAGKALRCQDQRGAWPGSLHPHTATPG